MDFHRWWENDPRERFRLEITDRTDRGIDLNAPNSARDGREQWHYSLIHSTLPESQPWIGDVTSGGGPTRRCSRPSLVDR